MSRTYIGDWRVSRLSRYILTYWAWKNFFCLIHLVLGLCGNYNVIVSNTVLRAVGRYTIVNRKVGFFVRFYFHCKYMYIGKYNTIFYDKKSASYFSFLLKIYKRFQHGIWSISFENLVFCCSNVQFFNVSCCKVQNYFVLLQSIFTCKNVRR